MMQEVRGWVGLGEEYVEDDSESEDSQYEAKILRCLLQESKS